MNKSELQHICFSGIWKEDQQQISNKNDGPVYIFPALHSDLLENKIKKLYN